MRDLSTYQQVARGPARTTDISARLAPARSIALIFARTRASCETCVNWGRWRWRTASQMGVVFPECSTVCAHLLDSSPVLHGKYHERQGNEAGDVFLRRSSSIQLLRHFLLSFCRLMQGMCCPSSIIGNIGTLFGQ